MDADKINHLCPSVYICGFPCLGFIRWILVGLGTCVGLLFAPPATADDDDLLNPLIDFTTEEWTALDSSVDRGLAWLATQQTENGSIGNQLPRYQPALTSLAAMAFLSRGYQPGRGPYGKLLDRAINFVISTQDKYGLFVTSPSYEDHALTYNHAISGVMLAEVLGMTGRQRNERINRAITRGLEATTRLQQRHQDIPHDRGGWRYIKREELDADLSVTTWHLLFLRAAKNAGYDVPETQVIEASHFVRRCFQPDLREFCYMPGRGNSISMTGAGILCLYLAGQYDDPFAKQALTTVRDYDFAGMASSGNRYPYYTCYHCSQVASQTDGEVRRIVLRGITTYLLDLQKVDGSWPAQGSTIQAGASYATAMAILALTPAYQILPIYQQ